MKKKAAREYGASLLDFVNPHPPTGYNKFTEVHSEEVNTQVKETRNTPGYAYTDHAALFQKGMSAKWKELPKEEKEEWNRIAKAADGFDRVYP